MKKSLKYYNLQYKITWIFYPLLVIFIITALLFIFLTAVCFSDVYKRQAPYNLAYSIDVCAILNNNIKRNIYTVLA